MRSRIIGKDEAQGVDRWDSPAVDATAADALRGAERGGAHLLTAGQLDALQRQVHEEAYRRGFDEGLAAGKAELASRAARLAALGVACAEPFHSLERAVEDEIVNLAIALSVHLVRREIAADPALLHAAIHDCLAVLASTVRDVTLYLHPDDVALLKPELAASGEARFKLAADSNLPRGDLRVASSSSVVDGSLSARCAEIIAVARAESRVPGQPA